MYGGCYFSFRNMIEPFSIEWSDEAWFNTPNTLFLHIIVTKMVTDA